jgi:DNA-binding LacI/PurR family transcriptional regulator
MSTKINNNQKANIKYIAKSLRENPSASLKTTEKILKIAKELNYYPNYIAKGLREKKRISSP